MSLSLLDNFSHSLQAQAFDANPAKPVLEDHRLPPDLARFMAKDARLPAEAMAAEVLFSEAGLRYHQTFADREASSNIAVE